MRDPIASFSILGSNIAGITVTNCITGVSISIGTSIVKVHGVSVVNASALVMRDMAFRTFLAHTVVSSSDSEWFHAAATASTRAGGCAAAAPIGVRGDGATTHVLLALGVPGESGAKEAAVPVGAFPGLPGLQTAANPR